MTTAHLRHESDPTLPLWLRPGGLAVIVGVLTLAKLAVAGLSGLAEDEAYYRLWGLDPALGYYDHPPMIGWWTWAGMELSGDGALGVRLVPILSALLGSLALWRTGLLLFGARAAGYAVLLFNASLLIGIGSLMATPDAPSVFFWGLAIWALAELDASRNPWWWITIGLIAGLGLTSKYSVLFLGAGIVLWLLFVPRARVWWGAWQLWAGGLLAVLLFAPVVQWNAAHEWASFVKQFGRAVPHGWTLRYVGEFFGGLAGLLNPLTAVLAILGVGRAVARARKGDSAAGLLLWTSVPFFAYLLLHSFHDRVQANWPAPLFPALTLLAAWIAAEPPAFSARVWRGLAGAAVVIGFAASGLVYVHAVAPLTGSLARKDPTFQTRGWSEVRAQVLRLAGENGAGWVATQGYGLNAQLAFALRDTDIPVRQLTERIRYVMTPPLPGETVARPALFVSEERRDPGVAGLSTRFGAVTRVAVLTRAVKGVALERLVVYRVSAPLGGDPRDPVYPLP
ncbi:glycosyltransferase family 39 protein [Stappia sp.]|uniref:glycosyltransferase family 39 protein n=1 Tax=Stappia sp. TaxID=1870903 RepID=UPI003A99784B